jgi:hypothetical protein
MWTSKTRKIYRLSATKDGILICALLSIYGHVKYDNGIKKRVWNHWTKKLVRQQAVSWKTEMKISVWH